ncbi:MAG: thioredoxin family protein [Janthinobacterium lividum]
MATLQWSTDAARIAERLADTDVVLVACLCADWCGSCREYRLVFDQLATTSPGHCFVWIDVETHADLVEHLEIDDFPTLLIEDTERVRFFGPVLPHAGVLSRMLATAAVDPQAANTASLRRLLRAD